jgi:hypothetical protein
MISRFQSLIESSQTGTGKNSSNLSKGQNISKPEH